MGSPKLQKGKPVSLSTSKAVQGIIFRLIFLGLVLLIVFGVVAVIACLTGVGVTSGLPCASIGFFLVGLADVAFTGMMVGKVIWSLLRKEHLVFGSWAL